ncbi:hypothetical protein K438DRAFT_1988984 [Mycena galopus ATCC 62051]|nr:hypothetical protein K438DRAFT_1988984 [Mycena galopus ATCC 62051]
MNGMFGDMNHGTIYVLGSLPMYKTCPNQLVAPETQLPSYIFSLLLEMHVRFAIAALLAGTSVAGPTTTVTVTAPAPSITSISQCSTGDAQCCNSLQAANTSPVGLLLGHLGIVPPDLDGHVSVSGFFAPRVI